jgi:hypothetical protein
MDAIRHGNGSNDYKRVSDVSLWNIVYVRLDATRSEDTMKEMYIVKRVSGT